MKMQHSMRRTKNNAFVWPTLDVAGQSFQNEVTQCDVAAMHDSFPDDNVSQWKLKLSSAD